MEFDAATIAATKKALVERHPDLEGAFGSLTNHIGEVVSEIQRIVDAGNTPIPQLGYDEIVRGGLSNTVADQVRRRGCVIVRGVFPESQAQQWNDKLAEYVESNNYYELEKEKRGLDKYFSELASDAPQIFGIYWSRPQVMARQSEPLAKTRAWLNRLWDSGPADFPEFDPDHECSYADRIRRRRPGDNTLGLSPHIDGGTIERWLDPGYQSLYRDVFQGDWRQHNPFCAIGRTRTQEIPSPAVCHMFRTYQGWTALTTQGPGDGTLKLLPIARAMSWILLRALMADVADGDLCGARPGRALSLTEEHHAPLLKALVPIPKVNPGDTVWWHPDVAHAVEDRHTGSGYSNVMYIGAAPECDKNRAFLAKQAQAFIAGKSSPDFAPEDYEVAFNNRATEADLTPQGRRQMGLA
jgi:hypothetical protein